MSSKYPDVRGASRSGRRTFIGGTAKAAAAAAAGLLLPSTASAEAREIGSRKVRSAGSGEKRRTQAYHIRLEAARRELHRPVADHPANGDEELYVNKIASYSKGLPHDPLGEVDPAGYRSFIRALDTGDPADFERIVLGGSARLVNPQAGLAFELEGPDPHSLTVRPAPAFSSAEEAAEMTENYWMALLRDVPMSEYDFHPVAVGAAEDLSRLADFRGPKVGSRVTSATLFRGNTPGDLAGPYISQFLWKDTPFGAEAVDRRMRTSAGGLDYMTSYAEWLWVQNGGSTGAGARDATPRYIRNGRDLGEWVHIDVLFQAYFNALLILFDIGAPVDSGNPYTGSRTQAGFGTLGDPYIASVLCAVATRALKSVWFQKWFVHRRLRPEVFGGRVQNHMTGAAHYPIHADVLNSQAALEVFRRNGTYLLPMAYPEGSPLHPSYGAGHATVAGACVTILKAYFDESFVIPDPMEAAADGLSLTPYSGQDLTVGGELNKLASNVAIGRNIAGVHWRSDAVESLKLGEEVAIRFLREERDCLNEPFDGFSLTRFDGTRVTV